MTLDELNAAPAAQMVAALDGVFEHAPWVAERAAASRPFATVAALHQAMMAAVLGAPEAEQLTFLRGHPELGGVAARGGLDGGPFGRGAACAWAGQSGSGPGGGDRAAQHGLWRAFRLSVHPLREPAYPGVDPGAV